MATGNISSSGNSLDTLTNLLGLLKGSKETTTTGSNISQAGMNQVLQQILGGSQGLASVAQGQKSAGIYNSSTNQLLTNDLITRTAGELAKQQAGTTTTRTAPAKVSGQNAATVLALSGAKSLFGPAISGAAKKAGVNNLGDKFADALGLGNSSTVDSSGTNLFAGQSPSDFGSGVANALADFGSGLADSLTVDTAGAGIDAIGSGFSQAADSAAADVAGSVATSVAEDTTTSAAGDFFSSLFG